MKAELALSVLGIIVSTPGLALALTLTSHPKIRASRKWRWTVSGLLLLCLAGYVICLWCLGDVENHLH